MNERNLYNDFDLHRTLNLVADAANMADDARERKDLDTFLRAVEIIDAHMESIWVYVRELHA